MSARARAGAAVIGLVCIAGSLTAGAPLAHPATSSASGSGREMLVPIGGGYTKKTLQGFSQAVARDSSGRFIQMVVVPAAYGFSRKHRKANIRLALVRTAELQRACVAIAAGFGHRKCSAKLSLIFDRADARRPRNVHSIAAPGLDGVFFLGGNQDIAMRVLSGTPVERAMAAAYHRGVVFGGSSAGDAVLSASMIWGYRQTGGPQTSLQKSSVRVWWANDAIPRRGLSFGARNAVFDEHFYSRGRFGRLLNVVAQSGEHFHGSSLLGVGVDYGTGITDVQGRQLRDVFGSSSVALIDFQTAHATYSFVGPDMTLSARNVVTDIVSQDSALSYDLSTRTPVLDGHSVPLGKIGSLEPGMFRAPGRGMLLLGGDIARDPTGPVMSGFTRTVSAQRGGVLVVAVGYPSHGEARAAAAAYGKLLSRGGLNEKRHPVRTLAYGAGRPWPSRLLDGVRGVVFVGGDQADLAPAITDRAFGRFVHRAVAQTPVVLTDRAMTAAMGRWYVANHDPTASNVQTQAINDFRTGYLQVRPGFDVLPALAIEPRLTADERWGRLYGLAMDHPNTIPVGISEETGLALTRQGGTALGYRSIVVLDARRARFLPGGKGFFSALNVVLDTFAAGERVPR